MHNQVFVLEGETHKIHWDFVIQTDHLISSRQPDQAIVNKKGEAAEKWTLPFRMITG